MPICKKCNEKFPCRIKIDDKFRNAGNRKYCLTCSPWGKHNTRQLENAELKVGEAFPIQKLVCSICDRKYDYHHNSTKGHTKLKCNSCLVNIRRFEIKDRAIAFKGGSCQRCGYNKCTRALAFHHEDPNEKDFNISGAHCHSWAKIQAEIEKCLLLCHNCHAEEHDRLDILNDSIATKHKQHLKEDNQLD